MVKSIRFPQHARDRMVERGVQQEEVEAVVRNPDIVLPVQRGRTRVIGTVRGQSLNVVYEETAEAVMIVTVFWVPT
jgi:uncharacterized protein DUF4258